MEKNKRVSFRKGRFDVLMKPSGELKKIWGWIYGSLGIVDDPNREGYSITHLPSGMRVTWSSEIKEAKEVVKQLSERFDFSQSVAKLNSNKGLIKYIKSLEESNNDRA